MSSDLQIEGKKYISSKRAAQICGYTQDYVGQLIRENKIVAQRMGRAWFVSEESILSYLKIVEAKAQESTLSPIASGGISDKREGVSLASSDSDETSVAAPSKILSYSADKKPFLPELKKVSPVVQSVRPTAPATLPLKNVFSAYRSQMIAGALSLLILASGYLITVGQGKVGSMIADSAEKVRLATEAKELARAQALDVALEDALIAPRLASPASNVATVSEIVDSTGAVIESVITSIYDGLRSIFGFSDDSQSDAEQVASLPISEEVVDEPLEVAVAANEPEEEIAVARPIISESPEPDATTTAEESGIETSPALIYDIDDYTAVANLVNRGFDVKFGILSADLDYKLKYIENKISLLAQNERTNTRGAVDYLSGRTTTTVSTVLATSGLTLSGTTLDGSTVVSGTLTVSDLLAAGDITFASATGTNAVLTRATTTSLYISGAIRGAGLSSCSGSGDKVLWNSTTGQFECGLDAGGSGSGVTGLRGQYSSFQTGASQTFATSSDTNITLTITSSGDTHTFAPGWTGTLAATRGGTGLSSITNNQLLIGGAGNTVTQIATSSLGLLTTNVAEGSYLYFTNARVLTYLDTLDKGYFFSTTSSDYWKTQNNFFSTTSASYFLAQNQGNAFSTTSASYFSSQGLAFSTTSTDYWESTKSRWATTSASYFLSQNQGNAFSTTSAQYFVHSSTTIPKTYTSNTFTGTNIFSGSVGIGSLNGPLHANNGTVSATTSIGVLYGGTGLSSAPAYGNILFIPRHQHH
jgi:hypothetical protein